MASTQGRDRIDGTVLIVEDQPAVAKALLLLFDIHGIDAIAVSTPADAEDVIRRGDADAVVQDMNFTPGATGGEQGLALFRTVRAIDPGMPVILLTAWTALETAVQRIVTLSLQVAGADVPVLITGPNGTGKEKIADLIQANSRRRKAPFIKVNAGALPDELLESELFGAE